MNRIATIDDDQTRTKSKDISIDFLGRKFDQKLLFVFLLQKYFFFIIRTITNSLFTFHTFDCVHLRMNRDDRCLRCKTFPKTEWCACQQHVNVFTLHERCLTGELNEQICNIRTCRDEFVVVGCSFSSLCIYDTRTQSRHTTHSLTLSSYLCT